MKQRILSFELGLLFVLLTGCCAGNLPCPREQQGEHNPPTPTKQKHAIEAGSG